MLVSRNWLQNYFEKELPTGEELADLLMKHAFEIERTKDTGENFLIDIDVLPNRAHDCLSHRGIAREIAGLLGIETKEVSNIYLEPNKFEKSKLKLEINIKEEKKCRRYIGRTIENIKVQDSPGWLKKALEFIGQRPKNNIVDATNFALFDLGQPTHIFDLDKLASPEINIRNATPGEKITLLSDEEIILDKEMLVVADADGLIAVAGVKGGKRAEVDAGTKNIVIEIANFEPVSIRRTRQKLGIMTDASKRFENELAPELAGEVVGYLTNLILSVAGSKDTKIGEIIDAYPAKDQEKVSVEFSLEYTNKLLGTQIIRDEITEILERFGYRFQVRDEKFFVEIPSARYDLRIPEDMIEEIGRIYGYDKIKGDTVEKLNYQPKINKLFFYQNKLRNFLVEKGYSEVETYIFRADGEVKVSNPVAKDKPFLRTNIKDGLAESLGLNSKNAGLFAMDTIKLFEFGKVFCGDKEINKLAISVKNVNKSAKKKYGEDRAICMIIFEEIEKALGIQTSSFNSFNLDPKRPIIEINFDELINDLPDVDEYGDVLSLHSYQKEDKFKLFSQYPFVSRDIAIWVPENISAEEVKKVILKNAGQNLIRVDLFDKFGKDEKISYAFRLIFQSNEKTMSDDEANSSMNSIVSELQKLNWEVR